METAKLTPSLNVVFRARDRTLDLNSRVLLMGILNITPDSFFDGGRYLDTGAAVEHAQAMIEQGADIIDVGAESTRPGAEEVDEGEELARLGPVLRELRRRTSALISVDTRKSSVASMALELGVDIINDVSALRFDPLMGEIVSKAKAGLVLMHMQGTPQTMQNNPQYLDVVDETKAFLAGRMETAQAMGIGREHILLDPGIGFGKNVSQNLTLLSSVEQFQELGRPVMIGPSRKTFIGHLLNKPVEERLMGTAAVVAVAVMKGAQVVRVHDVAPLREVIDTAVALRSCCSV